MAIALDHSTISSAGLSSGSSLTTTSSTGNLSVVSICLSATAGSVTSVTDNKGNSYGLAVKQDDSLSDLEIWYSINSATTITSVTVNFTGTATMRFAVYDCSGAHITSPLVNSDFIESTGTGSSATTNPVGPTVNYNYAGTFSVAIVFSTGGVTAVASPYTLDLASNNGLAHSANAGTGVFQPSWTTTGSQLWCGVSALFASDTGTNNVRFVKGKFAAGLGSGSPTTIITNPITTVKGDLICLICVSQNGSAPFFTDNKSNTFIDVTGMNPFGTVDYVSYCVLTTGGTNHKFQFNNTANTVGPILGIIITPNTTPTLTTSNTFDTGAVNETTFTGVSITPNIGDYLFNFVDVEDGVETSFTANGLWQLGSFEIDGNSYSDPQALAYQFDAVGGTTSDNLSVTPNSAPAREMILAFTISSARASISDAFMF